MRFAPIRLNPEKIIAIFRGATQFREIINPQPQVVPDLGGTAWPLRLGAHRITSKPGAPDRWIEDAAPHKVGNILWVQERSYFNGGGWCYRAGMPNDVAKGIAWRSPSRMPLRACRLFLKVTEIHVHRIQEISEDAAVSEGMHRFTKDNHVFKWWPCDPCDGPWKRAWQDLPRNAREAFASFWDFTQRAGAWERNDWVLAYAFERVHAEDARRMLGL